MKRLIAILAILVGSALAQNSPVVGNMPDNSPTPPPKCITGQIYSNTSSAKGLYFCNPDNNWVGPFGTGSGSGNVSAGGTLTNNAVVIGQGTTAVATISASTTTTQALFATAGAPAFRAVAAGDLPSTLTSGTAIANAALTTPALGTPASGTLTNATGLPLSGVVSPTGAVATIADGDNTVTFNSATTTAGRVHFTVGETTASTSTGAPVGLRATTLIGSTAIPLSVDNSLNGSQTIPTVSITPTWNTSGVVNGALLVNPTNTGSGALSKLIVAQASNVTKWSVDKGGITSQSGVIGTYNAIATTSNGVPSIYGAADVTGKATNQTITTLYTPTATGLYRITCYLKVTRAATTSSILGTGTTNGVIITYTDGTDSVAQSVTMPMFSETGALVAGATGNAGNATTTSLNGTIYINALTAVAIQFTIGYTSVGGTTMQYEAHLKAEAM